MSIERLPQRLDLASLVRHRSERIRLLLAVSTVGAAGGVIGAAYVGALRLMSAALWPDHWDVAPHLLILAGVGLLVGLLYRALGTPGDVEILVDNIHLTGRSEDVADLRSLLPISLLCISAGGAMGPEAPLVQTTGGFGSWLAQKWNVSVIDARTLTITGMAAGFTVLFGAPLGSAVFALEILHRRGLEYYEALFPAIVGSLAGFVVNLLLSGTGLTPAFHFPTVVSLERADLLWGIGCGVVGAVVAALFTYLARAMQRVLRPVPPTARPFIGGVALGLLAIWSPYALTFGEAQINTVVVTRAAAITFALAALAKLLGTAVTIATGWRGGFIIPLFFMGVTLGQAIHVLVPSSDRIVLIACLMAAINCGVTKTPLGSALVVAEMAGLRLLPPVLLASAISLVLTSNVNLIHSQRARERDAESSTGFTPDELGPVA